LKKILITGSEGFIGKSLLSELSTTNNFYDVHTLSRTGNGLKHIRADITLDNVSDKIVEINPDVIVHLAGNVSVPFSLKNPLEDFKINAAGTLSILNAAQNTDCNNFIYVTSGGAIYDATSPMPLHEDSPIKPISPYGLSKYVAESYVSLMSGIGRTAWTSLALSNCYGPLSTHKQGVISRYWNDLLSGVQPVINGIGVERDFIHILDVTKAIVHAIEKPSNCRLNISSNSTTRLEDLLERMQNILGSHLEPIIRELPLGEVKINRLDNSKAKDFYSWSPEFSLDHDLEYILAN
jgi:UDP-glucose 4-epimerase